MASDDYPYGLEDGRTAAQRLADLRSVQRQVIAIMREADDGMVGRLVLEAVRASHAETDDLVTFDEVRDKHGTTTLAVDTELLVRTSDYERYRGTFEAQGLRPLDDRRQRSLAKRVDGDPLGGRVTRLTGDGVALERAAQLASSLRLQGIQVSLNHVTPMGGQWKSVAGPERTAGEVPKAPKATGAASSVRVVVLDTGVHESGRKGKGWLAGLQTKGNGEDLYANARRRLLHHGAGHGTFCAGVVQQVAPDVEIAVRRVLDRDGIEDEITVARHMVAAVQEAFAARKHVVLSLSLGAETVDDERPVAFSVALERIAELQRDTRGANPGKREALVVAAAGNFGHDRPCYPAAFPEVLAVAALTQGLLPAAWSSRGAWVDACTIGEGVRSTFVPGAESPEFDPRPETFGDGDWALWTGTSFAAPQVAAAIAQIAHRDGLGLAEARWQLLAGKPEIPLYGRRVEILPAI